MNTIKPVESERIPIIDPIALEGDELMRYLEIRMLRKFFDRSGHRPITWDKNGQVGPGQWKMRPHKNE